MLRIARGREELRPMGKTQAQTQLLDAAPTLCRGQMPPPSSVPIPGLVRRSRDSQVEAPLGADRLALKPVALLARLGRDLSWGRWWDHPRSLRSAVQVSPPSANESCA